MKEQTKKMTELQTSPVMDFI